MVDELIKRMAKWGYLNRMDLVRVLTQGIDASTIMETAIKRFKDKWGPKYRLEDNADLDDGTKKLMEQRFCSCSDFITEQANGMLRKWNANKLSWRNNNVKVGSLSFEKGMEFTISEVSRVCNMTLIPRDRNSNIESYSARIDGPNGTLAEAYLPNFGQNPNTSLKQTFDTSEAETLNQHAYNLVIAHETLHSLGLSHDTTNAVSLMDPFLNRALTGLMPPEIKELVDRYGLPENENPGLPPTENKRLIIEYKGTIEKVSY